MIDMGSTAVIALVVGTIIVLLAPALILSGEGFSDRLRGRNRHE
jgi:hypothetical protein